MAYRGTFGQHQITIERARPTRKAKPTSEKLKEASDSSSESSDERSKNGRESSYSEGEVKDADESQSEPDSDAVSVINQNHAEQLQPHTRCHTAEMVN